MAVFSGLLEVVEELFNGTIDPDIRDYIGRTALHRAVFYSKTEIASLLLKNGFDVNSQIHDRYRSVPLQIAVEYRDAAMATLLLETNANANVTGSRGETCLHRLADGYQNLEILELLLQYRPNVDAQDIEKISPLTSAAYKGNTQ